MMEQVQHESNDSMPANEYSVTAWRVDAGGSVARCKDGQIVLDQIRAVDKGRLVRRLGRIDEPTQGKVLPVLAEMFAR